MLDLDGGEGGAGLGECCVRPVLAGTGRRGWRQRRGDRGDRSRGGVDRGTCEFVRVFFLGMRESGGVGVDRARVDRAKVEAT